MESATALVPELKALPCLPRSSPAWRRSLLFDNCPRILARQCSGNTIGTQLSRTYHPGSYFIPPAHLAHVCFHSRAIERATQRQHKLLWRFLYSFEDYCFSRIL